MNKISKYIFGFGMLAITATSCTSGGDNPGIEYAPDMYISKGYEPFSQQKRSDYNPNGMTMRLPVSGTIARGQMDYTYAYPNTPEGYEASATNMNRVPATKANLADGEALYLTYCSSCHGKTGGNDGAVFASGKFPPPPWANYQSEYVQTLPDGKIYHTITFGKNMMGSHASVLNPTERWKVINYVKSLSLGSKFVVAAETAGNAIPEPVLADSSTTGGTDLNKVQQSITK